MSLFAFRESKSDQQIPTLISQSLFEAMHSTLNAFALSQLLFESLHWTNVAIHFSPFLYESLQNLFATRVPSLTNELDLGSPISFTLQDIPRKAFVTHLTLTFFPRFFCLHQKLTFPFSICHSYEICKFQKDTSL